MKLKSRCSTKFTLEAHQLRQRVRPLPAVRVPQRLPPLPQQRLPQSPPLPLVLVAMP